MELEPGVFVSSIATDEWEDDPEVGGRVHVLHAGDDGADAGMSLFEEVPAEPVTWTLPERETIHVLEGAVRIEIAGGVTLELSAGDIASMPKGADTTWHLTRVPYKELWVIG